MTPATPPRKQGSEPTAIVLVGSARSGTTWLARLLDHHPRLIYRHEPDVVYRGGHLPRHPPAALFEALAPNARGYLQLLLQARLSKTFGPRPAVRKPYRSWPAHVARTTLAVALRTAERLPGGWRARQFPIPDLIDDHATAPLPLVKGVESLSRLGMFAHAAPPVRFVHIVRHPCAVVASMLRGIAMKKLHRNLDPELPGMRAAGGRGTENALEISTIQRLALMWAIDNEAAMNDTAGYDNVRLVRYEDLCSDTIGQLRELLRWLGLGLDPGVERAAVRSAINIGERDGYFGLVRDPAITVNRWRNDLSVAQIETIRDTVRDYRPATLYAFDRPPGFA